VDRASASVGRDTGSNPVRGVGFKSRQKLELLPGFTNRTTEAAQSNHLSLYGFGVYQTTKDAPMNQQAQREQRGLELAKAAKISRNGMAWQVPSQSSRKRYRCSP
jgi:hypothetical protein